MHLRGRAGTSPLSWASRAEEACLCHLLMNPINLFQDPQRPGGSLDCGFLSLKAGLAPSLSRLQLRKRFIATSTLLPRLSPYSWDTSSNHPRLIHPSLIF